MDLGEPVEMGSWCGHQTVEAKVNVSQKRRIFVWTIFVALVYKLT